MTDVLRIPIPVEALRTSLGDAKVDEALSFAREQAAGGDFREGTREVVTEAIAAGFLVVDTVRKLRMADIYENRLALAVSMMGRDVRNQYEAALTESISGTGPVAA